MTLFRDYTYKWWQVGVIKVASLCVGLAVGAYWCGFFSQYLLLLLAIVVVCGVYISYVTFGSK